MSIPIAPDERQLTVAIDQLNMPLLSNNQYQLHVAKSVIANGTRKYLRSLARDNVSHTE